MKIAVINQDASTGGWNYVYFLLENIKKYYPEIEITLFWETIGSCPFNIEEDFAKIKVKSIRFPFSLQNVEYKNKFNIKLLNDIYHKYKLNKIKKKMNWKKTQSLDFNNLKRELNKFNFVFFSWPYGNVRALDLNIPVFFIVHDFIFTHFFGLHNGNSYNKDWYKQTKNNLKQFIDKNGIAIASTQYVAEEFKKTFPDYKREIPVILLSNLNNYEKLAEEKCTEILEKFDIKDDYILFATNDSHHKNMGQVLGTYYHIKQKYPNIKMIITGYKTEGIRVVCNSPFYCDHVEENEPYNIKSLGLINNEEFAAIIQKTKVLINASLCEAGCGSGLDAWTFGVPTAISSIPPYLEQVEKLGVKTEFFNPRNSEDIAKAVIKLLDNPEFAKENARISKEALSKYTWKDVAKQYAEVFSIK